MKLLERLNPFTRPKSVEAAKKAHDLTLTADEIRSKLEELRADAAVVNAVIDEHETLRELGSVTEGRPFAAAQKRRDQLVAEIVQLERRLAALGRAEAVQAERKAEAEQADRAQAIQECRAELFQINDDVLPVVEQLVALSEKSEELSRNLGLLGDHKGANQALPAFRFVLDTSGRSGAFIFDQKGLSALRKHLMTARERLSVEVQQAERDLRKLGTERARIADQVRALRRDKEAAQQSLSRTVNWDGRVEDVNQHARSSDDLSRIERELDAKARELAQMDAAITEAQRAVEAARKTALDGSR